jgi:hypothetical protein
MKILPVRGKSDSMKNLIFTFPCFAVSPKNFLKELDKDGGVDLKFGSKK